MRVAPDFANEPAPSNKFERNAIELPRYAAIERDFSGHVQRMVGDFLSGRTDEQTLKSAFKGRLMDAETDAFVAGRRARGDTRTTISDNEAEMLAGRHSRNMRYWHGFVDDMKANRGTMPYMQRADLYAKSLWSIYTRGETTDWEDPENANARYWPILDVEAEHCPDCINRAKLARDNDGLTWEQMDEYGWPGEKCQCGPACRCHVRVVRKKLVLPERFNDAQVASNASDGYKTIQQLLGGEELPLKIPAAGVPFVKLPPEVLNSSLAKAGEARDDLAKRLPLVPLALTSPVDIIDGSGGMKHYIGNGLTITIGKNDDGIWQIIALILGDDWRKAA